MGSVAIPVGDGGKAKYLSKYSRTTSSSSSGSYTVRLDGLNPSNKYRVFLSSFTWSGDTDYFATYCSHDGSGNVTWYDRAHVNSSVRAFGEIPVLTGATYVSLTMRQWNNSSQGLIVAEKI